MHGISENEANHIIEVLADGDINASKVMNNAGREVVYDIAVPAHSSPRCVSLNKHELPRRRDRGYHEIFAVGGLIPTSAEEKAKSLSALEGEIERQLKLIDGVLDVQVQLVIPDESALRTTRSRSRDHGERHHQVPAGRRGARPIASPRCRPSSPRASRSSCRRTWWCSCGLAGPPRADKRRHAPTAHGAADARQRSSSPSGYVGLLIVVPWRLRLFSRRSVSLRTVRGASCGCRTKSPRREQEAEPMQSSAAVRATA